MAQSSQLEKLLPNNRISEDFNELEEEDGVWIESDYLGTNSTFLEKLKLFLRINWPIIKKPVVSFSIAIIIFLLFIFPIFNRSSPEGFLYSEIRLPTSVIPHAYRLDFTTSLENSSFNGIANIDIEIKEETNYIVIHSEKLTLKKVKVINGKKKWKVHSIKKNEEKQYSVLLFKTFFEKNKNYTLSIEYEGLLADDMNGYYISKYGPNDNPSYLATTQFEPTFARKAFPCFDEPAMKATFQLNMTVGTGLTAISNMNVVKIEDIKKSGKRKFIFAESTRMSTYLVAFIVSSFKSISKKNKNVEINVYSRPDQLNTTHYALEVTAKVLRYYEMLFDIAYPLPKLDMVAIPDFEAGAMENWGLVTFRETALLYDETSSSALNKQYISTVIAHELAHQWFGNLVTMKWWDDLWLNEGFAEFMEYLGTNAAEPEWKMQDEWYYMDVIKAFKSDSSIYTHPISATVKDPEEISGLFDDISYSKGSSVIRMIRSWVNNINSKMEKREPFANDYFFNRIHKYLLTYAYDNAETHQLWESLESYDKNGKEIMNVSKAMGTFTDQSGYPIVMMNKNSKDTKIDLTQERYLVNRIGMSNEELNKWTVNATWTIPFSYMIFSNETGKPEILEEAKSITITKESNSTIYLPNSIYNKREEDSQTPVTKLFVKGNPGQTGFYKVQYEDDSIKTMCEWLRNDVSFITPIDRAGFLFDITSQLYNGRTENPEIIMECLNFLKNENSNIVWQSAIDVLKKLLHNFDIHPSQGNVKQFISSLINNITKNIGWQEGENDNDNSDNNNDNKDGDNDNDENGRKKIIKTSISPTTTVDEKSSKPTITRNVNEELRSTKKLLRKRGNKINNNTKRNDKEDTIHNRAKLRASILELASVVGESEIKNQALDLFEQIKNNTLKNEYDQDVLSVIYSTGVRYGEVKGLNYVLEQYRKESSSQKKDMLKDALASTTTPYLQQRIFELAISDEIREQDTNFLLMKTIRNGGTSAARLCWIFVKEHWDDYFIKRFPTGNAGFSRLLGTIAEYLANDELFNDIITWIDDGDSEIDENVELKNNEKKSNRKVPSNSKKLVKRGIEFGKASILWTKNEKYGKRVSKWLESQP